MTGRVTPRFPVPWRFPCACPGMLWLALAPAACSPQDTSQAGADPEPPLCTPGANTCEGTRAMRCQDDGQLDIVEDCADTMRVCQDGRCQSCAEEELFIERDPGDLLLLLDRSGSMAGEPWDDLFAATASLLDAFESEIRFGLMMFPTDDECGGPPDVAVPLQDDTLDAILDALDEAAVVGGTPTAGALLAACGYLHAIPDDFRPKNVLLATDGNPNCNPDLDIETCRCAILNPFGDSPEPVPGGCAGTDGYAEYECVDDERTIAAARACFEAGIRVFVIGAPSSAHYIEDVMDAIAAAGGTGAHIDVRIPSRLAAAMQDVAARVASCSFAVSDQDEADMSVVNVYVDGEVLPRNTDGGDGWDWAGEGIIEFRGTACERLLDGSISTVSATFGCPTEIF